MLLDLERKYNQTVGKKQQKIKTKHVVTSTLKKSFDTKFTYSLFL